MTATRQGAGGTREGLYTGSFYAKQLATQLSDRHHLLEGSWHRRCGPGARAQLACGSLCDSSACCAGF